ncbi:flavin-containing monooxygenase [Nocardioides stalactiti]|uniref:flavin-containing monooxygenase n=1 Tax=Nocardioides stalactiti TaxID=2755356 RepID=UPI001600C89A|nr:NAD(P)/FAD-dependent oxidoreductase [Nocardioides stalactiti]
MARRKTPLRAVPDVTVPDETVPDHHVAVVGAGFAGMGAAIMLQKAGIEDVVILERKGEVGGTWRDNTYPGVAVDIPSFTYSYVFEPNASWSRAFAPGHELKQYAEHCADRYRLRDKIRFHADVTSARFDEADHVWRLSLAGGDHVTARFLLSCHGSLITPKPPEIPGLEDFEGHVISTMDWDHDHDLTGERVAVIGTGASGLQVIPAIAPTVGSLTVYQRTPIWVLPKVNPRIPGPARAALGTVPFAHRALRFGTSAATEVIALSGIYNRQAPYAVKGLEQVCRAFLRAQVPDPELREKLTPSYGFACKRPSFSNSYYRAFLRDNVELVTDGIERITATGIRTRDGVERPIDTLVLATGFKVFDVPYDLYGTEGLTLNEHWVKDRKQTYEGTSVRGWPNLFLCPGPYGVAGPSLFTAWELCTRHAVQVVREADRQRATRVEISAAAQEHWLERMRAKVGDTIFVNPSCAGSNSYYVDAHGDAPFLRPTSTLHAWWHQRRVVHDDYEYAAAAPAAHPGADTRRRLIAGGH